jgi:lysophospholipid acyltransferase (LPLAT)-like uncharacterized protein
MLAFGSTRSEHPKVKNDRPGPAPQVEAVAHGGGADVAPAAPPAAPRHHFWARFLGWWSAAILYLQKATWRTRVEGLAELDRVQAAGETVLMVFWHGKYVPLFPLLKGRRACVFTTRSFRGEIISEVGRHFGFEGVQLSEEGEARSFVRMRKALMSRKAGAIAVDGPLGPYHVVKPGIIELASRSGCVLIPASSASRHKWVRKGRWDRMERPLPFTRVAMVVGPPLRIPRGLAGREVASWQERVHDAVEAADRTAREIAGSD